MNYASLKSTLLSLVAITLLVAPEAVLAAEGRKPLYGCETINSSGSYILTRDLDLAAGNPPGCASKTKVFEITADNVTIDLDGHSIKASGSITAVVYAADKAGIRITNGFIFDGGIGIQISNSTTTNSVVQVDHIQFAGQTASAISISGDAANNKKVLAVVESNLIEGRHSTTDGIYMFNIGDSTVVNNTVDDVTANGINLSGAKNTAVRGNTTSGIGSSGAGVGIMIGGDNNSISDNIASECAGGGISVTGVNNAIKGNNTSFCGDGIKLTGSGNSVQYNSSSGNSGGGRGILIDSPASNNSVDWNVATRNNACGIQVNTGNNLITNNRTAGNAVTSGCTPSLQTAQCGGGGAGVQVPGINAVGGNTLCSNVGIP